MTPQPHFYIHTQEENAESHVEFYLFFLSEIHKLDFASFSNLTLMYIRETHWRCYSSCWADNTGNGWGKSTLYRWRGWDFSWVGIHDKACMEKFISQHVEIDLLSDPRSMQERQLTLGCRNLAILTSKLPLCDQRVSFFTLEH